ncbi:MAG: pyridoxamine 5'-phosphate oxidase family protein [Actinomycetota bacterium]
MNWDRFASAAPDLAAIGVRRLEGPGVCLVGTLRKDGSPRISPVEPMIVDGELLLGMMWHSRKALDLLRDARVTVHSVVTDRHGTEGDFKVFGRTAEVTEPGRRERYADAMHARIDWRPEDPYHLFAVDIATAGYVVFGDDPHALAWDPQGGVRRRAMPGS